MAPSFLSGFKFKATSPTSPRERRPSETSPRTSVTVPRGRSSSTSQSNLNVTSPTTPTQASTLISNKVPAPPISTDNITINKAQSHQSFESAETSSTQPNVTIVPPSPLAQTSEFFDDDSEEQEHTTTLASTSGPTTSKKDQPPPVPTQNLMSGTANPAMASNASLAPGTFQVPKRKLSTQSMKSAKKVPSELNLNGNHFKAATTPATGDGNPDSASIVESPTDISPPASVPVATAEKPNGASTNNLTIQRHNTDASSINSKSGRPWRRSTTRKPTGLASAIAASGLAMANPALSASHQAQISPPAIMSAPQSTTSKKSTPRSGLPYMSPSPAQSNTSHQHLRTRSADLSLPKSARSRRGTGSSKGSRPRKSSVSVNSDNGSTYGPGGDEVRPEYYSGLDDFSDDGSGSELDSDMDLADDVIPVTGFAVASNKRNADFHELFPAVPEGDYLIEGKRPLLHIFLFFFPDNSFFFARLWLRVTERNSNPRTTLHLGESYLLPC